MGHGAERSLAGQKLIQRHSQAVEVAAPVDEEGRVNVFGAHVLRRPHTGRAVCGGVSRFRHPREPEVG